MQEAVLSRVDFDPYFMAPETPSEALQFALTWDGQRPPAGHSMDFIQPGFAPLFNFHRVTLSPEQKLLLLFYDNSTIQVPAILLYEDLNLPLSDPRIQWLLNSLPKYLTRKVGLFPDKDHPPPELFYAMFQLTDQTTWIQTAFIIQDINKNPSDLRGEIFGLRDQTDAPPQLIGMKLAAYYMLTGDSLGMDFSICPRLNRDAYRDEIDKEKKQYGIK